MLEVGTRRCTEMLAFRDYLCARPGAVSEYADLKRTLAGRPVPERGDYTDAKAPFISAFWQLVDDDQRAVRACAQTTAGLSGPESHGGIAPYRIASRRLHRRTSLMFIGNGSI